MPLHYFCQVTTVEFVEAVKCLSFHTQFLSVFFIILSVETHTYSLKMLSVYRSMRFGTWLSYNISPLKYLDWYFVFIEMTVDDCCDALWSIRAFVSIEADQIVAGTQYAAYLFKILWKRCFSATTLASWVNRGEFELPKGALSILLIAPISTGNFLFHCGKGRLVNEGFFWGGVVRKENQMTLFVWCSQFVVKANGLILVCWRGKTLMVWCFVCFK